MRRLNNFVNRDRTNGSKFSGEGSWPGWWSYSAGALFPNLRPFGKMFGFKDNTSRGASEGTLTLTFSFETHRYNEAADAFTRIIKKSSKSKILASVMPV